MRRNQILGGSRLKGNEIYLEGGERRRGGVREKPVGIIERMLARLRREIEMLSPSRAYRRRGQRAKAIKRVRNVESFAESKVVECETTRCRKHTHTHQRKRDLQWLLLVIWFLFVKLYEHIYISYSTCHVFKNRPLLGFLHV